MNTVHPSATVGAQARLGEHNEIGPGCVIEDGVTLGSHNKLWMNVYLGPGTTLGDGNQLHMGVVIGHLPQDVAFSGGESFTRIGSRNTFREYATIHRGTAVGSATVVGDDNFLMANAHLGHNCQVGHRTTLVNLATFAGYCTVEDDVLISGLVAVHQHTRIGRLAMVSGCSWLLKDVPPFMLAAGRRAVVHGLNVVGMRRVGIPPPVRAEIKRAYRLLYREGLNVSHALDAIERECQSSEAQYIIEFVKSSKRGICQGSRSDEDDAGGREVPDNLDTRLSK